MGKIENFYQTADWKNEKHVPVIEAPQAVPSAERFQVTISIGKEVPHPNTTAHHIRWIQLFFKPDNDKFIYQVGNFEFTAHGESVQGEDQGPINTHHSVKVGLEIKVPGTLIATSFCNIHGLWENTQPIAIA